MNFNKVKNFILNKENLIIFYFYGLFLQKFAFLYIFPYEFSKPFQYFFWLVNPLWFVILIINDIRKKNIHFKDRMDLTQIIFITFTCFVYLFLANNHDLLDGNILLGYIELGYLLFTYPEETSLKEYKQFFDRLSNHLLAFIVPMTVISFLIYILQLDKVTTLYGVKYTTETSRNLRFNGLFRVSTEANFFCHLGLLLHLSKIHNHKNIVINSILGAIDAILVVLSGTRLGILTLCIIFVYYLFVVLQNKFNIKISYKLIGLCLSLAIIIPIIAILLKKPNIINNIIEDPYETLNTISSGRLHPFQIIIDTITPNRIIYGYGWNNNSILSPSIIHPHNMFLAIFLYTGIIGTAIFMIFFMQVIKNIAKNMKSIKENNLEDYLIIAICVFFSSLLDIAIIGDTNINSIFFWLALAPICHLHLMPKGNNEL